MYIFGRKSDNKTTIPEGVEYTVQTVYSGLDALCADAVYLT